MTTTTTLSDKLNAIGLRHLASSFNDVIAEATKKRWTPAQFLEHVIEAESHERTQRSLERRFLSSRLGKYKPIADFDWNWPKVLDRDLVEAALRLDFLDEARNIVLVANQGLGKTMIAKNIAAHAIQAGRSVLFCTTSQALMDLAGQETSRSLDRRLRHYTAPHLLVLDEVGFVSYDNRNADLLFQLVSRRYEERSTVFTTNLAFADWPTIFPNAACTIALIDRVVHHADLISIQGDSYRRREAEQNKLASSKRRRV